MIENLFDAITAAQISLGMLNATTAASAEVRGPKVSFNVKNAHDSSITPPQEKMSHFADLEKEMAKQLDVSDLIVNFLGSASGVLENSLYVVLFLIFMLVNDTPHNAHANSTPSVLPADRGQPGWSPLIVLPPQGGVEG